MNSTNTSSPNVPLSTERLVLSLRALPVIPGIVADALRILEDPSSSAEEIGEVVQRDQALAARSLRVANSAAFGMPRRVGTIREAIVMIGVRRMRGMVSAMAARPLGLWCWPIIWRICMAQNRLIGRLRQSCRRGCRRVWDWTRIC